MRGGYLEQHWIFMDWPGSGVGRGEVRMLLHCQGEAEREKKNLSFSLVSVWKIPFFIDRLKYLTFIHIL